jgi:acid phosphatase (class A)
MHPLTRRSILLALLFPALSAQADLATKAAPVAPSAPSTPYIPEKTGYYITGKEQVFTSFPTAPKLNSERDLSDLEITLLTQASRNKEQIQEAVTDQHYGDAIQAMNHLVDPAFEITYPETSDLAQLLSHADGDGSLIMYRLKKQNARLRPYLQHPELVVALFAVKDFSYPSGHASGSELQARLLAALFPAHALEVLNKARMIAESRVVAGVHYESDIQAGEVLGDLVFSTLQASPKFQRDFAKVQSELAGK